MGYLSCRADFSVSTCRSISSLPPTKKSNENQQESNNNNSDDDDGKIRHFSYNELESATGNFSDSSLLGRGSHGAVYRAVIKRTAIAVKRPSRRLNSRSSAEIDNEIGILSSIRSSRLVNLVGYTDALGHRERLLVVELMPNGNLYDLLHTRPRSPSWPRRIRLALQTAKALLVLHSASPPVIHRDVKSANILIDRSFGARLGDFGLALRLDKSVGFSSSSSFRFTPPAGTLGYLDPCYVTPEDLSTKTDVFSFGILLLEILSGRKAIDVAHSPPSVIEWAIPLLKKGKVSALYDPRIPLPRDSAVRRQLALLAASCVRSSDDRRPGMEEVVERLEVLSKAVSSWNGISVGNPCSVVETERTHLKVIPDGLDRRSRQMPATAIKKALPLKSGSRVFSDADSRRDGRNLKEILARPDGEFARASLISRARTLRVAGNYYAMNGRKMMQRNNTLKEVRFDSTKQNSDGRVRGLVKDVVL